MSAPASSGGSSAPSVNSSPQSGSGGAGGAGGSHAPHPSHGGEGGGFDPSAALQEARRARQEAQSLRSTFDKRDTEFRQTKETLDRVRQAFVPEEQSKAPDPIADLEEQMDYYLEQAMEAKARGGGIPLTTNLALKFFQSQIENHKTQQQLLQEIAALKAQTEKANSPDRTVNDHAYAQMEGQIQNALDSLYGDDQGSLGTKRTVYQGVVQLLQADLTELQQKAPHKWDMLRRNPQELAKIVQSAVQRIVPPRAMQIIQQEQLQNTPMKEGELWAAFREADNIKDPNERRRIKTQIRQDILETQINRRNRRR